MKHFSLTYDFGTGSVKAALVTPEFEILAAAGVSYPTHSPENGWAEQSPEVAWHAMVEVTHSVMTQSGITPSQIKGIAISHTGSTIVFIDQQGTPLYDCVMWMDGRGQQQAQALNERAGASLYTGKNVIAKLCWFMEHHPHLIEKAYRLVDLQGYLHHRMTGELAYEFTGARTTRLFDVVNGCWDASAFALSGFPRRLLPDRVVRSEDLIGHLTAHAALTLGLSEGTPVFGGCCDHATAILGAACANAGDAHIYIGTSAWLAATVDDYNDCPSIRPSPIPGKWYHYFESDTGGIATEYLIRNHYYAEQAQGRDVYALIAEESSQLSSYQDLLFLAFLSGASAPIDDVSARGSLLNLSYNTTRGQIARAVLEGPAYNLRWLKEIYESTHHETLTTLRGIGGGMILPENVQIYADILGVPITTMSNPRVAGNIGLAVCVEVGLGEHPEGYSILEKTGVFDTVYMPRPQYQARYDSLYALYRQAFQALHPIYAKLNNGKVDT